jgi:ComF family protein
VLIGKYHLICEPFCKKCSLPLDPKFPICENCWDIENFNVARAVGLYFKYGYKGTLPYIKMPENDLLSTHIRFLKNSKNISANIKWAVPIGLAMVLCINNRFTEFKSANLIVPVPQHPNSIARRGYNQAEEIAKVVSDKLDIQIRTDILTKVKDITMRGKSREERRELVKGAYQSTLKLNGEAVLLIDDTLTTGSNLDECAKILKNIGAKDVYVMVAGRDVFEY